MMKSLRYFVLTIHFCTLALGFGACVKTNENEVDTQKKLDESVIKQYLTDLNLLAQANKTSSGLYYINLVNNESGLKPVKGDTLKVHYVGKLPYKYIFDGSYHNNQPLEFVLGIGQLVRGFEEGAALMRVGEKKKFIIPSDLGYGTKGNGSIIPPNAVLDFEIELVSFKKQK